MQNLSPLLSEVAAHQQIFWLQQSRPFALAQRRPYIDALVH